jgi:hypothetical protein
MAYPALQSTGWETPGPIDSQFPVRLPIDFALFTRATPAANSGGMRMISRGTRQALTAGLQKPGSCRYQPKKLVQRYCYTRVIQALL